MNNKRKLVEMLLMLGTLAAVAAINYTIVHNSLLFIALIILLAHELGHYVVAKMHGADPKLPIFLPLPFILIAATRVRHVGRKATRRIAFAGPFTGFCTALMMLIAALAFGLSTQIIITLLTLCITEVVFNFVGSDGKRYRAA